MRCIAFAPLRFPFDPSVKHLPAGPLLLALKSLLACLLLALLAIYLKPAGLWSAFKRVDLIWVLPAALLGLAGFVVQWAKWQRLLERHRPGTTWGEGLQTLLVGFALGLVSPGRIGELGRGLFLRGRGRMGLIGLAALDRLSSVAVTLLAGVAGLWVVYPAGRIWIACLLPGLVGAGFLFRRLQGGWNSTRLREAVRVFKETPRRLWLELSGWSTLFNLIFFSQFYLLVRSAGEIPAELVWGIPLIFAIKAVLPFSFLDLGVREGAAVLVFSRLGLDPAPAFNAALILFIFNVLLPGMVGLTVIYRQTTALLGGERKARGLSERAVARS